DRWLILIAYLMGLSIGVHLLNLLTIPALAYIYYFKRHKVTTAGLIKTGIAGVPILVCVQYGIIQGFEKIGANFHPFFVNTHGLILIAYLMGLSIGVHLLNLLTIPALAYIYYFKRHKVTTAGLIKTGIAGVAILGFVQYGIIQGFVKIGAHFDLFFVNTLGL